MKIPLQQADLKLSEAVDFYKKELGNFRVGRGSLQLIENIQAEVYGQNMPLNQIGTISMVDASLVTVSPWDKTNIPAVVKAIQQANLGINPSADGELIRLPIPPMTEERRLEYTKLVKMKAEESKIAIRDIRREVMESVEEDKANLGEDEVKRNEKELQAKIEAANGQIEQLAADKEKELMTV